MTANNDKQPIKGVTELYEYKLDLDNQTNAPPNKWVNYLATGVVTLITTGILSLLGTTYVSLQTIARMEIQQQIMQKQLDRLVEDSRKIYTEEDAIKDLRIRDYQIEELRDRIKKLEK